MKISTTAALLAAMAISSLAASQTLPPPAFAGQSYWFGPGPQGLSVTSSVQDYGGYSEMYQDGSGAWQAGVNGGPAFVNAHLGTSMGHDIMISHFRLNTAMTLAPYIYVDGYFGVSANVVGFGSSSSLSLGSSRFYIVHNCPISILAVNFEELLPSGPGPNIPTTYEVQYANYANPGAFSGSSGTLIGNTMMSFQLNIDPASDGSILQVDIARHMTFPGFPPRSGIYTAGADFEVSSL